MVSQVMHVLKTGSRASTEVNGTAPPFWILRITNTRLADIFLDICGVPSKEATRRSCFSLLTRISPSIAEFWEEINQRGDSRPVFEGDAQSLVDEFLSMHQLSDTAKQNLIFLIEHLMKRKSDPIAVVENFKNTLTAMVASDGFEKQGRALKRIEDAARAVRNLSALVDRLVDFTNPITGSSVSIDERSVASRPVYISIDLGLRQRRRHYHGGILFQAIYLPEDIFTDALDPELDNDCLLSPSGKGIKVAEGGDFSELVRKYRPPGNFADAAFSTYTSAPVPIALGVRILVGKLVEICYMQSAVQSETSIRELEEASGSSSNNALVAIRKSLSHPFYYMDTIQCVVASPHGLDTASTSDRFRVACRLWCEGISAEYLPHSGLFLSLVKRMRDEPEDGSGASDWTLTELYGVCALLGVPYCVIVQPHLVKERKCVRVRKIDSDMLSQGVGSGVSGETIVPLDALAATLKEGLSLGNHNYSTSSSQGAVMLSSELSSSNMKPQRESSQSLATIDCVIVEDDGYYNSSNISKSETPRWKTYLKAQKRVERSSESFLSSMKTMNQGNGLFVFSCSLPFFVLRQYGTSLLRHEKNHMLTTLAFQETESEKYKKSLKTLSAAIDHAMKRHRIADILLHSSLEDRFDLVSLSLPEKKPHQSHRGRYQG